MDNYENEAYIKSYLDTFLSGMNLIFQACNQEETIAIKMLSEMQLPKLHVIGAEKTLYEKSSNYSGFTLTVGFYLNFVWIIGIFLGLLMVSDRVDKTLVRIQQTPIKGFQYMIGSVSFYFIIGMLVPIIFLGVLKVKKIDFGFSYWIAAILILLINLFVIGLSIIFSMLINSKIGVVVGVYTFGALVAILGGAYFDISGLTGSITRVNKLTPTYWYMDCVRKLQSVKEFNPSFHIMFLLLFGVLTLLIASALFERQVEVKG